MVDPPREGRESSECVELFNEEVDRTYNGMKERAQMLTNTFNQMEFTSCTKIEGAMYAFPKINFTDKAL